MRKLGTLNLSPCFHPLWTTLSGNTLSFSTISGCYLCGGLWTICTV